MSDTSVSPVSDLFRKALRLHQAGDLDAAEELYREILRDDSEHPGAWHLLGCLFASRGEVEEALTYIERALSLCDTKGVYYNNYGATLEKAGRLEEAEAAFERAIEINPEYPDALANLGALQRRRGALDAAVKSLQAALDLAPEHADAHRHLAGTHRDARELDAAADCYRRALVLRPGDPGLLNEFGGVCMLGERWDEAESCLRDAVSADPNMAEAWINLGGVCSVQDRVPEAEACFRKGASLRPDNPLWKHKELELCPVIFSSQEEIDAYRSDLASKLDDLADAPPEFDWASVLEDGFRPSFQLAHHGRCNRALLERFARIYSAKAPPPPVRAARSGPVRVGFLATGAQVGNFLRWYGPLIGRLSRRELDVVVFCPSVEISRCRRFVAACCDGEERVQWISLPDALVPASKAVSAANVDVLLHFQIGTSPQSYFLPFMRPAAIQCASWGSMDTSGMECIDYFLSSELAEPRDAQEHYTEELVRFESVPTYQILSRCLPSSEVDRAAERARFELPADATVYFCPQKPAKYHPEFDILLKGVLEADPSFHILALRGRFPAAMKRLFARWSRTLGERLMRRIHVVPKQPHDAYLRLVASSDVVLDSPHFAASVTGFDALAAAVPLVTMRGRYVVERVASSLYRRMGMDELVTENLQETIDLAARLGADPEYRRTLSDRIAERRELLFEDEATVDEFERFFRRCRQTAVPLSKTTMGETTASEPIQTGSAPPGAG